MVNSLAQTASVVIVLALVLVIAFLYNQQGNSHTTTTDSNRSSAIVGSSRTARVVEPVVADESVSELEFENRKAFAQFVSTYNPLYTDQVERGYRYATFTANRARAAQLYQSSNGIAHFGVNEFSDMPPEEFAVSRLNQSKPTIAEYEVGYTAPLVRSGKRPRTASWTPTVLKSGLCKNRPASWQVSEFDWRTCGAITPVQDQGQCGSCWAFASSSALASARYLSTGVKQQLSPEQLVECDKTANGCSGGWPTNAFAYVNENGLESSQKYSYVSSQGNVGRCVYNKEDVALRTVKDFNSLPNDASLIQRALFEVGPLTVAIDATNLQTYQSGIFDGPRVQAAPNHAVLLVGWGVSNGVPYWIVKNSWGPSWGMGGYFHMLRGKNSCYVEQFATYVQV